MTVKTIPLYGGLDLTTPKTEAPAGTLFDSMNFEQGVLDGYSTSGFAEPFDGTARITDYIVLRFSKNGGNNVTQPAVGDSIKIGDSTSKEASGTVLSATSEVVKFGIVNVTVYYVYALYPANYQIPSDRTQSVYNVTTSGLLSIDEFTFSQVRELTGQASNFDTYLRAQTSTARDAIIPVPGRYAFDLDSNADVQSTVHGGHFYADRQYAVCDYNALLCNIVALTDTADIPLNGDRVYVLSSALDIKCRADVVKPVLESGDWLMTGSKARLIVRNEFGFSSSLVLNVADSDHFYIADLNDDFLGGGGGVGVPLGEHSEPTGLTRFGTYYYYRDKDNNRFISAFDTEAGLYAANNGWQEIDMLREVRFRAGTTALETLSQQYNGFTLRRTGELAGAAVSYTSTGALAPSVYSNPNASHVQWSGAAANLATDDGSNVVTATGGSNTFTFASLYARGFATTSIPDNATITGFTLTFERNAAGANGSVVEDYVALVNIGPFGIASGVPKMTASKAGGTAWVVGTPVDETYGGQNDLWGLASVDVQAVKSGDFGVYFRVRMQDSDATLDMQAILDYLTLNVHYINATSTIYFRNAGGASISDVTGEIIRVTKTSGDWDASTAEGILTVKMDRDSQKARLVGAGDQIRSASGGGGSLYATANSSDYPVTLPSFEQLKAKETQFVGVNENFFADEGYEAMFLVNGCGPACAYNGREFIRIHTELLPSIDTPVFVARHGPYLVLGYLSGILLFSGITTNGSDPLDYTSDNGTVAEEMGDRLTGLLSLNADALGVFCRGKIVSLRGLDSQNLQTQVIAADSGCLPYTAVAMGENFNVYANNFGIYGITPTDQFGDYAPGGLSEKVWPFLEPRVQAEARFPELRLGPTIVRRSRQQCIFPFKDGYYLSLTFRGPERTPIFMKGRWSGRQVTINSSAGQYPVFHTNTGIDSKGKEHVFCTHLPTPNVSPSLANKVLEHGIGRTFNGLPLEHWILCNYIDASDSMFLKQYDQMFLYGAVEGYATLRITKQVNFRKPALTTGATTNMHTITLGESTDNASLDPEAKATSFDCRTEGFNLALKIEATNGHTFATSDTETQQGRVTLQSMAPVTQNRGLSRGKARN